MTITTIIAIMLV